MREKRTVSVLSNLYNINTETSENLNNFINRKNGTINIDKYENGLDEKIHNKSISSVNLHKRNSGIKKSGFRGETAAVIGGSLIINQSLACNSAVYSAKVNEAYNNLVNNLVRRGNTYINNNAFQRAGYMAENYVADTYNLDAAIKNIDDRAVVFESHGKCSGDIGYDHGKKLVSLKFCSTAEKSSKAQLNPGYGDQQRLVPADQLEEAKGIFKKLARKNRLKGRNDASDHIEEVGEKLTDKIRGSEGAESTPLNREKAVELAKAVSKDKDGKIFIDKKKIDKNLKKERQKAGNAKIKKDAIGFGIAVIIGATISGAIYCWSNKDNIKLKELGISALRGGGISAVNWSIGKLVESRFKKYYLKEKTISGCTSVGVEVNYLKKATISGCISVGVFSAVNFIKLKIKGYSIRRSLKMTFEDVTVPGVAGVAGAAIGYKIGGFINIPFAKEIGGVIGGLLGTVGAGIAINCYENSKYEIVLDDCQVYEMEIIGIKIFARYDNEEHKFESEGAFGFA